MMNVKDVDPNIKRMFPWALFLFLFLAAMFAFGAITLAHAQPAPDITCEEVVKRVGMKPLWLAERDARKKYPELTESQIAWGRQCVTDHRRAVVKSLVDKIEGAF